MSSQNDKQARFQQIQKEIEINGFNIVDKDWDRPWGGFFVIDEGQAETFADHYFQAQSADGINKTGKLSPKILMVQPHERNSWQYHHRRAEMWKIIEGPVGVVISDTDEEGPLQAKAVGEIIRIKQGERHRLAGLDKWGVVAEMWQHTDKNNPSDEDDIVRVQDDYGR
jgi:mannose-6-phosphate isomerase-like protein (cupin superfamily)